MPTIPGLAADLPYLRRYARALTGSRDHGDALVMGVLAAAQADPAIAAMIRESRLGLFRFFTAFWLRQPLPADHAAIFAPDSAERAAQARLGLTSSAQRQALLLTMVEDFSEAEAAAIMAIARAEVLRLVTAAIAAIEREARTSVLVIEDEPLIALQLADIVETLGHEVCGMAATRREAHALALCNRPGLVLADIQLADGSSGLDAVDDIAAAIDYAVPHVVITAFPERLLTGTGREPAWLVTKPFQARAVRAAISQALFFRPEIERA